ncbi:lamin tail domain-containing protein [Oceanobacillus manasiensis]|uniref:lamin tail domain-containing protein n=1 Tax=Oceanobacillus manasiensis TaxID=586413 RepID=UPI000694FE36|nr:lamin tail domain-containing protein [Oceanobacillus manasiensis]
MRNRRVHRLFAAITAIFLFVSTLLQPGTIALAAVEIPDGKKIDQNGETATTDEPLETDQDIIDTSSEKIAITFQHEKPPILTDSKSQDITVSIPNAENAQLHYKSTKDSKPVLVDMNKAASDAFTASIPDTALWAEDVAYWFTAANAESQAQSDVYTVKVDKQVDRKDEQAPKLFIAEANLDEEPFIEIYNNTNQTLLLKDYQLFIGEKEVSFPEDRKVSPQDTVVIWPTKSGADISQFNKHYNATIEEKDIIIIETTISSGDVPIKLVDKESTEIVSLVNYISNDTKSQLFYYSNGEMKNGGNAEAATPGVLVAGQVPEQPIVIESETEKSTEETKGTENDASKEEDKPTTAEENPEQDTTKSQTLEKKTDQVMDHEEITEIDGNADLTIEATVKEASEVTVEYKTGKGMEKKELPLTNKESSDLYSVTIPKEELWSPHFSYRIIAKTNDSETFSLPEAGQVEAVVTVEGETDFQQVPRILITEITPDTVNVNGADAYEFIEIYNNSNQAINMQDYQVIYRYPTNTADQIWNLTDDKIIQPQESFIVWIKNGGNQELELADFNNHYGFNLPESHATEIQSAGMANGSERTLIVADKFSNEIVSATYNKDGKDVYPDKGIVYSYPRQGNTMLKVGIGETVTPLTIVDGQVPQKPVVIDDSSKKPVIAEPNFSITEENITVEVEIRSDQEILGAILSVQQSKDIDFQTLHMVPSEADASVYTVTIPRKHIWSDQVTYFLTASNQSGETSTEQKDIKIPAEPVDYQKVPALLITELVPDTVNANGADAYEFIEVYNNSTETIDFSDYTLRYRYPNRGAEGDLIWGPEEDQEVIIPSGETVVFWVINHGNTDKGSDDFNANFNSNLIEGKNLFKIYNDGMANGSERTLIIASKTGEELSYATYNEVAGVKDTVPDKGIFYRYPTGGGLHTTKISAGEWEATPGKVMTEQVPPEKVQLPEDTIKPVIEIASIEGPITAKQPITLSAKVTDQLGVKSVFLYYRIDGTDDFRKVSLERQKDDYYGHIVYEPELIGKSELEYYFVASDGRNRTTSERIKLAIENQNLQEGLRLNVSNEDLLSGEKVIKATTDQYSTETELYIDDNQVTDTFMAMETEAYFAFDVKDTNIYFQNGVTMGDEILEIFDDTYTKFTTITVPISAERLNQGENTITIRSGNKVSPFDDESKENRNDFTIRNIRLVLSDGTTLYDPQYSDPTKNHPIGDNPGKEWVYDFNFELEEEQFTSTAYLFDTSTVEDGEHKVKAVYEEEEVEATVVTDNTAPVLKPTIVEGETYKGALTIDAEATDTGSSVEEVTAQLDGEYISLPYETSSALLSAGEHHVIFRATDLAGNTAEEKVSFYVVEENPLLPDWLSNDAEGTSANLSVKVTDPTNDVMDVAFYESYQYTAEDANLVISENAVDTEPPNGYMPDGEERLIEKQREALQKLDGNELSTESDLQFPYHRFDVTVDEMVDENDEIEIVWDGSSLPGRKVTMYAWNYATDSWDVLTSTIAGEEAFQLIGSVSGSKYLQDHKVSVIVQDQIADIGEDFSFIWMADTQYYSESYPYIYEKQVNWIAENQQERNIEYVFHSGDLVNVYDDFDQWEVADQSMRVLDEAGIPYGVVAGNHDVYNKSRDYRNYSEFFGEERFAGNSYYGGSFEDNRGHYDLISVNGIDFIMVHLGWGIEEEGIEWLNEVLEAHPNHKAILNVHEYLLATGNRSPTGDLLFEKVVVPNENVFAVLCGHYHNAQTLIDEIDDNGDGTPDRSVYQMLADYQGGPEGGQGYLRILNFNMDENKIDVETYSPHLDNYNYYDPKDFPGKDQFSLDFDMAAQTKKVATDYVEVNVYTDELIGEVTGVPSGETASVTWNELNPNSEYFWYVEATDQYGGKKRSDIWRFLTVDGEIVEPDNPEDPDIPEAPQDPDEGNAGEDGEKPGEIADPGNQENPVVENPSADNDPDKEKDENKQPTDLNDNKDDNQVIENTTHHGGKSGGSALPVTATTIYLYLLLGAIMLLSGVGIWMVSYYRKKYLFGDVN